MAPVADWSPVFAQLSELVKSFGTVPAFARWHGIWEKLEVRRCGSTVTGLYVAGQSDLDVVLYFRGCDISRPEQLVLLGALSEELKRRQGNASRVQLIEAKAPIVQFTMGGLIVDVSVQAVLGLANSSLVAQYCNHSPHLRLLVRKVKEFASAWNIKSGKDGTLSSYGYTLLCTHFLQNARHTGMDLPVLPVFPTGTVPWEELGLSKDVENDDPNSARKFSKHLKLHQFEDWTRQQTQPTYYSMPQIAHAVQFLPLPPEVVTAPHVEARHVVVLFAHFAAWLLALLQGGLERAQALQAGQEWPLKVDPYVVTIRGTEQAAAWQRFHSKLDRHAFLYIEEPFSGDNVARPLTYDGAMAMQSAFKKAIQQLEAHPLARSLGVSSHIMAKARQARKADYAFAHVMHGLHEYETSNDRYYQYVGAH